MWDGSDLFHYCSFRCDEYKSEVCNTFPDVTFNNQYKGGTKVGIH